MWWRRNRAWLAGLLALVPLAVAAHSSAYITVYRGREQVDPVVAKDNRATLHEVVPNKVKPVTRDVTVTLHAFREVGEDGNRRAAMGARLWSVDLEFDAPPGSPLTGCFLEIVDERGVRYGPTAGKVEMAGKPDAGDAAMFGTRCVPADAQGPAPDLGKQGAYVDSEKPRPRHWQAGATFAVPETVRPDRLRVYWQAPKYLDFPLPH